MMKQLYKGRYLIVIYYSNGEIKDVWTSVPKEKQSYISNVFNGRFKDTNIDFIDVFEKHNDCFAEEDKLFIKFLKEQNILCYRTQQERFKQNSSKTMSSYKYEKIKLLEKI